VFGIVSFCVNLGVSWYELFGVGKNVFISVSSKVLIIVSFRETVGANVSVLVGLCVFVGANVLVLIGIKVSVFFGRGMSAL